MQPDYAELYRMEDPFATQPVRLKPSPGVELDRNVAVGLLRGNIIPQPPLRLQRAAGGRFTDFMWCTFTPILVISQRLVELLAAHGFSGWRIYDVEASDKSDQIKHSYHGFAITGRAGGHDLRRVELVEKPPITPKGIPYRVLKGIYFEEDAWDGSDFCLMDENTSCIVTSKVVQAFGRAKIRNVHFTQLTQVEVPADVYEVLGLWPLRE
jgi:hypothetical protein